MKSNIFYHKILLILVYVCVVLFKGCATKSIEEKRINVVFRFDDFCAFSSTDIELRIIDAFRKNKASITFGVIPYICTGDVNDPSPRDVVPLTSMKGDILKNAIRDSIIDVALHGYSHQRIQVEDTTEFSGLAYQQQKERIAKGKKLLEDMIDAPVTIFVPPWNSYDSNTLRALEALGLSTLSAGLKGEAKLTSGLNFLPTTCGLTQLRKAVEISRNFSDPNLFIVVLFHEYDFKEVNEEHGNVTYQELCNLLEWLISQEDVRLLSIGQAIKVVNKLNAGCYLLNKHIYSLNHLLPIFLQKKANIMVYRETDVLLPVFFKVVVFYFLIMMISIAVSFMMGRLVFPKSVFIMRVITYGSMILAAIILLITFHNMEVYLKGMVFSTVAVGISIGVFISFQYLRKRKFLDNNSVKEINKIR